MKIFKTVVALTIVLALVVTMLCASFAAEMSEEDSKIYVLHHNVEGNGYTGPKFQYFSPYVTDYLFDGVPSYIQHNVFSLYNTVTGEVVPTYCTDIKVGALPDRHYRQLNLEDSTYAAASAGQLRSIVLNGYYLVPIKGETLDAHAVRSAQKLQELGDAAGVEGLTVGEAIAATQCAIWRSAHGAVLEFTDFVRSIYTTKLPNLTKYYDLCNEERINGHIDYTVSAYGQVSLNPDSDAYLNARIKAVYDYLLSLEPTAPTNMIVSPASFSNTTESNPVLNADGTYDITVSTTVDVSLSEGDSLTLTAAVNDTYFEDVALVDGRQNLTLTIENVPAELALNAVTLTIDGEQSVSEVFLYDAYGGRESAQTMIGMDSARMPVRAAVVATQPRILNIFKTSLVANGNDSYNRVPLEGIIFNIYHVADLAEYLNGEVVLPDAEDYEYPAMSDYIITTDANGWASFNFTQHGLPDGVYLIVERAHPAIKEPVKPFYITLPSTNAEGTGFTYEITAEPKNDVKGEVKVEKDVISLGNDSATLDAYAPHKWIISTNIPEDIEIGKSYSVSDTLDNRLDYLGNMQINVETLDGATTLLTLTPDVDYTVELTDVDSLSEGKPSDSFKVELTRTGMVKLAQTIPNGDFAGHALRLYFDAQINANAEMGEEIDNQAILKYVNSVNFEFVTESDKPVVYTGGSNLLKVDADNETTVLSGATFEVYRKATAEEVADGTDVTRIEGVAAPVVKVSFFDNAALHGDKVTSATSDENGRIVIYGLAYGEYYLVETTAPAGYNLLGKTVTLNIDATSHLEENIVLIENVSGSILPSTGGIGTTIFTVAGIFLMLASVVLIITKKRVSC